MTTLHSSCYGGIIVHFMSSSLSCFIDGKSYSILIVLQLWLFLESFSSSSAEMNGRCAERCNTHRPKGSKNAYTLHCHYEHQDNYLDVEECADDCKYCEPRICDEEKDPYVFMCPSVSVNGSIETGTEDNAITNDYRTSNLGFSNAYVSDDVLIIIFVLCGLFLLFIAGGSMFLCVRRRKSRQQQMIQGEGQGMNSPERVSSVQSMSTHGKGVRTQQRVSKISYVTSVQSSEMEAP